jgi:hypothetical protein
LDTLFYDFETYYDTEYSLRKMTPVEYILDPRYETIGCAFKWGVKGKSFWVDGPDCQKFFDSINPATTMTVAHNAPFDACIASFRYGFVPKLIVDTLGVARALLGHKLKSMSLDQVAKFLGLGSKTGALVKVLGLHLAQIKSMGLYDEFVDYALNDADLCAGIYEKLVLTGEFPPAELIVMDSVLRCVVEPSFELDQSKLMLHLEKVKRIKEEQLAIAMVAGLIEGPEDLMSNDKFAKVLRKVGIDPPMKVSLLTGMMAYAFAKSDPDFTDLLEHEDPRVQALMAARFGHKSTIEETRTERFISISNLQWPDGGAARMPVPLRYAGAHTHRLSGEWLLNMQNLPTRGSSAELRHALVAPQGYSVYAPDSSQIEARGVATFCGQRDLMRQFAGGEDVYSTFASLIFGFAVDKNVHKVERFIGKTGVLGLGYGVGSPKFQAQVGVQSLSMIGQSVMLTDQESKRVVDLYRGNYAMIPAMWKTLDRAINVLAYGGNLRIGPLVFSKGEILLPNGLKLKYLNLRKDAEGTWRYDYGTIIGKRLYGGALLENIIQALARIIVMDASTRIRLRSKMKFTMQVHDELVYVVPTVALPDFTPIVLEEMVRPPEWMPDWPLAVEAIAGPTYGDT